MHSEDSGQTGDWADAQVVLSLHWAHSHFVGFCHEGQFESCREKTSLKRIVTK